MRIFVLAGVCLLATSAAGSASQENISGFKTPVITPGGPKRANCPAISRYEAMNDRPERALRNLGELPPADHYKAVYRRIDGCIVPIIARYGIGTTGRQTPPRR